MTLLLDLLLVSLVERRLLEGNSIKVTQEKDASLKKEYLAETLGIDSGSNEVIIGGRKMAVILKEDGEMASRSSTGDAQKLNVEADMHASKKGPHDFLNNQGQETTLEKTTISPSQSSLKQGFSRSIASPSSFSTNKLFPHDHQTDEWRKLLEEADKKVMQMMRRDYGGMRRPRRKPPINNHEPRN
ncbi:hypothetical protein L1987_44056 [Smallanthus sonchifolius]|uniref:Uncharacterized protein n=1 Tax=Smallanthus sonchifolius TaxID=185202 RepID=A0ACB9GP45_9ASTR|nr:hypothetical protein L1987_44056 [Smallanthus sonchifolius]